ncbi:hypothetical protein PAEPH01_0947 [Pancytospora epiphaga]|nr:hypothetical protein PAEPH01_0947 [Pancytospora epiphaga]
MSQSKDVHQSYFTESKSSLVYICTTGISSTERQLFDLPNSVILQDTLDKNTNFVVTYKFLGTPKYLVALREKIKILYIGALYNLSSHYKSYEMRPFEGALFSTSGIKEALYINYFTLLKAQYQAHASIFLNFLIVNGEGSEKYNFCKEYGIPIINAQKVFEPESYCSYLHPARTDIKDESLSHIFIDKMFLLDKELPTELFNKLRRLIIFNGGLRVPEPDCSPDYIFTLDFKKYAEYGNKLFHYQYVFDCVEAGALLYPEFYKVYYVSSLKVLENCVCTLDTALGPEYAAYGMKMKSLGPIEQPIIDMRTTHFISRGRPMPDKAPASGCGRSNYLTVEPEWIDQCLGKLEKVNEIRFMRNDSSLSFRKRRRHKNIWEDMLVQVTGFSSEEMIPMIEKFRKYSIRYSESREYEGCTHLVMKELVQSEKFFSALSNGRWILKPEFLDDFQGQESFDFASYEWREDTWMNEKEIRMTKAIRVWREKIGNGGNLPFYNWVVKIYCQQKKQGAFTRLIGHGGGRITHWGNATHVFVDKEFKGVVQETNTRSTDYIFTYLINQK